MTGNGALDPNRKVSLIFAPMREVHYLLQDCVQPFDPNYRFDYHNYLLMMIRYILEEMNPKDPTLEATSCRPALRRLGLTEEQIYEIEHRVLLAALDYMHDALLTMEQLAKNPSRPIQAGYFYELDEQCDLVITVC